MSRVFLNLSNYLETLIIGSLALWGLTVTWLEIGEPIQISIERSGISLLLLYLSITQLLFWLKGYRNWRTLAIYTITYPIAVVSCWLLLRGIAKGIVFSDHLVAAVLNNIGAISWLIFVLLAPPILTRLWGSSRDA